VSKSFRNISIVAGSTVVSRLLGLVRDQLQAAVFGTSALNSAFVTAYTLPNLFRRLLGEGSLTAAFVPTIHDELAENQKTGAFALLNRVTSWLLVITTVLVALAMLAFSQARTLLPGHEPRWYVGADLTVLLFPYLVFVCAAAVFGAMLNVLHRFTEAALSPIWLNLAIILFLGGLGATFAHTPTGRMHWLCAGVLCGGFFQMAVPAAVLMREGWRPRFDLTVTPRLRQIAVLMAPGLFGTAIYQINIATSRALAFGLNDSAATVLYLANRLMEVPIGIFAVAVSTVIFPLITGHAARGDFDRMGSAYQKGLRLTLVINIPAAAGLVLLSEPIVRLLFQRGAFHAADTAMMAPVLAVFALGLPFFSFVNQVTRAFYALKDTRTPVKAAALSFGVNVVLSVVLMHWLSTVGLALASNLAVMVQAWYLQRALGRRMPQLRLGLLHASLGKIAVATLAMGAVVGGGWWVVRTGFGPARLADLAAVAGLIPLACVVYAGLLWVLKIEGREDFASVLGRLRSRITG
jgi:putative peptidoglycan lipid II flippase